MYEVFIDDYFEIRGCPENGVAAALWRAEHGIKENTNSGLYIECHVINRDLCINKNIINYLDTRADLYYGSAIKKHHKIDTYRRTSNRRTMSISPETAKVFSAEELEITTDILLLLWEDLTNCPNMLKLADERETKIMELAMLDDHDLWKRACNTWGGYNSDLTSWWSEPLKYRIVQIKETKELEEKNKKARREAEAAAEKAIEKQREQQRHNQMIEWIRNHGSIRLNRLVNEDIACFAVYRSERLELEYPGWELASTLDGSYKEARNCTEASLAMLDDARKTIPSATIKFWTDEPTKDEYGYAEKGWHGTVAVADSIFGELIYGHNRL
jgi:hypothetical protein